MNTILKDKIIAALELAIERLEMNNIEKSEQAFIDEIRPVLDEVEEFDASTLYLNFYECPDCKTQWEDEYECQVDDDCPNCGTRHISPYESKDMQTIDQED